MPPAAYCLSVRSALPVFFSIALLVSLQGRSHAQGHRDFWDLPPINYSDAAPTDALARLSADLSSGKEEFADGDGLARLGFVLKSLGIPPESQVLVFSKTSLQNPLIEPGNPRALFFSENAYVGYVPGGAIEAVVQDPVLGPVFYLIEPGREGELRIERDTNRCMSCHATSRTENVPGLLIRSVFADEGGHPLLHLGTTDVIHETPLAERWGGYYVTGQSALPHLGNRTFQEDGDLSPKPSKLADVQTRLDVSKYPRATSDIVSLLVLEHQCHMHSLLNAASMNYRRSRHFAEILDPEGDPDEGSAGRVATSWAEKITDCIFFRDEADLGEGVEGDPAFQRVFAARFPKTADGKSLADFRLYGHIFKNRCSYMVYSDAFRSLPPTVKKLVLERMRDTIAGKETGVDWLSASERRKIGHILSETLPGWVEGK